MTIENAITKIQKFSNNYGLELLIEKTHNKIIVCMNKMKKSISIFQLKNDVVFSNFLWSFEKEIIKQKHLNMPYRIEENNYNNLLDIDRLLKNEVI